ncbi:MAG TPA: AMP-binding protein [Corynebacteriales bacterium]|nr:AMP-binding protein [Mycobacteriales bacterium]
MSFNVEALFEKPTVDLSQVTTYMDIAEQRLAEIEAGEKEDYVIYRFFDYLNDPDGAWENPQTLTWVSLIKRAKAIGARLQQISDPGDRVVIMMPQNIDFVSAFVSCLYSGRIVVPAFSPTEPAHAGYLEAVLNDALPKVIITNVKVAREIRKFLKSVDVKQKPRVLAVEGVEDSMGQYWTRPEISPDDVAYLQYSSGSTRRPTAAKITQRGALLNVLQIMRSLGVRPRTRAVNWIPIFHAMSLAYLFAPPITYVCLDMMEPAAMLQQPSRWVRSWEAIDGEDVFSSGPDFSFGFVAARAKPEEGEELDLSNLIALMNGSESVTQGTVDFFNSTFMPYGMGPNVLRPAYGMSEATCCAATPGEGVPTYIAKVDGKALSEGRFVEVADDDADAGLPQVGVGGPMVGEWAVIVENELDENEEFTGRGKEVPDGTVGEIWLAGPNIADGYWGLDEESKKTFGNVLSEIQPDDVTHTIHDGERVPEGTTWLRTGDLGAYHKGQIFITGRLKDLIIIDGRNHVSTDIESTFNIAADGKFEQGTIAAFSVAAKDVLDSAEERTGRKLADDAKGEHLVIVAEENPEQPIEDYHKLLGDIRTLIARRHGVQLADMRIVAKEAIPRTATGKLKRSECSRLYRADQLEAHF